MVTLTATTTQATKMASTTETPIRVMEMVTEMGQTTKEIKTEETTATSKLLRAIHVTLLCWDCYKVWLYITIAFHRCITHQHIKKNI